MCTRDVCVCVFEREMKKVKEKTVGLGASMFYCCKDVRSFFLSFPFLDKVKEKFFQMKRHQASSIKRGKVRVCACISARKKILRLCFAIHYVRTFFPTREREREREKERDLEFDQ